MTDFKKRLVAPTINFCIGDSAFCDSKHQHHFSGVQEVGARGQDHHHEHMVKVNDPVMTLFIIVPHMSKDNLEIYL